MDALNYLKEDHRRIRQSFDNLSAGQVTGAYERYRLFGAIQDFLDAHSLMEQVLLYPTFAQAAETAKCVDEFVHDHGSMLQILLQINQLGVPKNAVALALFEENVEKLRVLAFMHMEAEETQFFPEVRKMLSPSELDELGEKMRSFRNQRGLAA